MVALLQRPTEAQESLLRQRGFMPIPHYKGSTTATWALHMGSLSYDLWPEAEVIADELSGLSFWLIHEDGIIREFGREAGSADRE